MFFLSFFTIHFYQLFTQHWSGVLDQDLIIIYNSILLNSGVEQEYRDHPAFTTFLINSLFYKVLFLFSNNPRDIDSIFNSTNIDETLQFYFYISRTINFFINILLLYFFNKILKKLNLKGNFVFYLYDIYSVNWVYQYIFFLRSENLSLLFFCLSINSLLTSKKNILMNFFIAGIFFAFAMLAKIQIIFLALYLIYLIPYVSKNNKNEINNSFVKKYLNFSLIIGFVFFYILQLYIQKFPSFENNKYIDLVFFTLSFIIIMIYFWFSSNFKKNLILFSSMLNGFVFLIVLIFLLDKINLLNVGDFIFLKISNPIHSMTLFIGEMAKGAVSIDYILNNIYKAFSSYRFSFIELIIIVSLVLYNFKKRNYLLILFFIFVINTLIMNLRYNTSYHLYYILIYLLLFEETIRNLSDKLIKKLIYPVLVIFLINSLNFLILKDNSFLITTLNRQNGMEKICYEFIYKIPSNTYENVDYIKYWHNKFNDKNLKKICDEII